MFLYTIRKTAMSPFNYSVKFRNVKHRILRIVSTVPETIYKQQRNNSDASNCILTVWIKLKVTEYDLLLKCWYTITVIKWTFFNCHRNKIHEFWYMVPSCNITEITYTPLIIVYINVFFYSQLVTAFTHTIHTIPK